MKRITIIAIVFIVNYSTPVVAQTIPRDELIFLTSEWKGERFADGRPKISDDLLRRAKAIAIEDAWTILSNEGYTCQYEGNWKMVHTDTPVVGRALTACFMPARPDVEKNIKERGKKEGRIGNTNSRLRYALDPATFMNRWCQEGPTHHVALGIGHQVARIEKLARLLGIELVVITRG